VVPRKNANDVAEFLIEFLILRRTRRNWAQFYSRRRTKMLVLALRKMPINWAGASQSGGDAAPSLIMRTEGCARSLALRRRLRRFYGN
jgi:hypothetical protein